MPRSTSISRFSSTWLIQLLSWLERSSLTLLYNVPLVLKPDSGGENLRSTIRLNTCFFISCSSALALKELKTKSRLIPTSEILVCGRSSASMSKVISGESMWPSSFSNTSIGYLRLSSGELATEGSLITSGVSGARDAS